MAPTTPVALSFEELRTTVLNKPVLRGPYGTAWQRVMGRAWDESLDKITQARRARWPGMAPSDALPYIGHERGLEQVRQVGVGGGFETEPQYRADLINAW